MLVIQMVGMLFGIFMAYYTFIHYKRNEFNSVVLIFWEAVWICMIAVALFPSIMDPIVHAMRFSRALDMLTVIGFVIVISVSFFTYVTTMKNQNKIESLVRKIALENPSVEKKARKGRK